MDGMPVCFIRLIKQLLDQKRYLVKRTKPNSQTLLLKDSVHEDSMEPGSGLWPQQMHHRVIWFV